MGIRVDRIRKERDGIKYFDGDLNLRFVNGVYDDSRKVYWNKNSGKWVFKKNKIYVDDFFSWDVYEYVNEEIIVGWFAEYGVSGVVEDKYFRYIDRVGYFLDRIIKKSNFDFKLVTDKMHVTLQLLSDGKDNYSWDMRSYEIIRFDEWWDAKLKAKQT